ncbi:hypothetical protein J4Q44_G00102530 [Coregonus suidteri]|uniref:Uncharacterized protein n=1 Tax=Coregonus suidteri TaxID=861788 RepID=A0AAN8R9U0_9TELE
MQRMLQQKLSCILCFCKDSSQDLTKSSLAGSQPGSPPSKWTKPLHQRRLTGLPVTTKRISSEIKQLC